MKVFRGTGTALITPFRNGLIDYDGVKQVIEYNISGGVDFLVPLGSTGEALTITPDEQRSLLDFVIKENDARLPIVAGNFGGSDTRAQAAKILEYNFDGIDAILISSPAYNKPSQQGIYEHYKRLLDSSPVPVILYNVPGRTSSNVLPETVARLAEEFTSLIAVKEACGDLKQIDRLISALPDHSCVLSGDDPTALETVRLGGQGVISVISNVYPRTMSTMINAAIQKKWKDAETLNASMDELHHWLYEDGNPPGIKEACTHRLALTTELRLPLVPVSEQTNTAISDLLKKSNLA